MKKYNKTMKLAGLNFKFNGFDDVSIRSNSLDLEMARYNLQNQISLDLILWIDRNKIAQVWYCDTAGGINKKMAYKILPKKIANLKDNNLFIKRSSIYIANKVAKEIKNIFKVPVQVKAF